MVGLLAAAMGVDKYGEGEAARIAELVALRCTTVKLPKQRQGRTLPMLRVADYHTIGGGYDKRTESMKKPRAASGAGLETVLSERHYLLDARFGILLEGERAWLDEIAAHLRNPKWGVWFGRKCCLPASPLLAGVADDLSAALRMLLAPTWYPEEQPIESFNHVVEGEAAEGADAEWLHDTPMAFGAPIGERHAPRRILQMHRK